MRAWVITLAFCLCTPAMAGSPSRKAFGNDRKALQQALQRANLIDPELVLMHFSHTCDLDVDGKKLHVVDVREILPRMPSPRGVNKIVVLDPTMKPVQVIRYTDERPLWCDGNRLLVFGKLLAGNAVEAGNVLIFSKAGRDLTTESIDWSTLKPAATGKRG